MTIEKLALSPDLLHQIFDSLADGVIVASVEGRLLLVNPAAEEILGLEFGDLPTAEWSSMPGCFEPDTTTPFPAGASPLARALRGEVGEDREFFVRRAAGGAGRWITVRSTPLRSSGGTVRGVVAVLRDVSARHETVEQTNLLARIVEETADSVVVTDGTGQIEYVNPAFERMTGFTRWEVLGKNPRLLKSGLHSTHFYEQLWSTLVQGHVFRGRLTDRRKDGEVFLSEQTITPIKTRHGVVTHLVSIARDVTELAKAEARESSLQLAREVQQRLYPPAPPPIPGLDVCGTAFAADIAGGDYFDFVTLPDACLGLVIGDVSGHGFDSAILMAQTRAVLRSVSLLEGDPGTILTNVNRVVVPDMGDNRFVGMIVVAIDPRTRAVSYANAGHTSGYLLDRAGAVKAELHSTGVPLGLFEDASFETRRFAALEPGDLLLLFTDGVSEASAPDGSMFGSERTLDEIRSRAGERASTILDSLCRAVRTFAAGAPQQDDITAIVCKVVEAV